MGENYETYVTLIKKVKKSYRFDYYNYNHGKDTLKQTKRERYIYNKNVSEVDKHPESNYFGQFGLAHIGLKRFLIVNEQNGFQSFSSNLNTNKKSPLKDKVCSIAIIYFEKQDRYPNKLIYYHKGFQYFWSRKKYLPTKLYKTLKANTDTEKTYIVNLTKSCNPMLEKANKNFQFIIFKR
jgi:hypothetical protein